MVSSDSEKPAGLQIESYHKFSNENLKARQLSVVVSQLS